jgi:hypothetical protein
LAQQVALISEDDGERDERYGVAVGQRMGAAGLIGDERLQPSHEVLVGVAVHLALPQGQEREDLDDAGAA